VRPPETWLCAAGALAMLLALVVPAKKAAAADVDLQLLLAVDVSPSVDPSEYALQINGLADAFRDPEVVAAISAAGPNGVAVALMQWAGPGEQVVSVPWDLVRDQATAAVFAAKIETVVRPSTNGGTAIGDALAQGVSLLGTSGFRAARQVVDISGDGRTNRGDSPAPVRNRAVAMGITVNGLVILNEEKELNVYYYSRVIGGPDAFVLQIRDFEDFARAIRLKLIREIEMAMATDPAAASGVVLSAPTGAHLRQRE